MMPYYADNISRRALLQYFRDVGPSYIVTKPTSGLCELGLGISEGFRRNKLFFGDDHDTVSRTHHPQKSKSKVRSSRFDFEAS